MRGRQRDAQRFLARGAGEHHDHAWRVRAFGQIFSVAGKGNAGVVDRALLQRRGDDGVEPALQGAVDSRVKQRQHVAPVGGIERTGYGRHAERMMFDTDLRLRQDSGRCPRARFKQSAIAEHAEMGIRP